ncbi:hypothetical protein CLOP_g21823 [Closterium sp. NIES-67]|nr:hypothetical protein CLOP_g21823 [Closterium sp. NIES-67]
MNTSPFTSPILFTPEKDGGLRMCIDYRALNRATINSRYPIPYVDELIDQLRCAHYFSKIFVAVTTRFESSLTTATRSPFVLAIGVTNTLSCRSGHAPSTFQLTMNGVFRDLLDKCVIIYLEDIMIYSTTREQHLKGADYQWGEKQQAAFDGLKNILISPLVLRIAHLERPFEVVTDASDIAIGAVLLQDFGDGLQPIAYDYVLHNHLQTDGQTERTNQTMEQLIRTNCPDISKWEDSLPMLEFSYNHAPLATTNHSPFLLNCGMDPT